MFAYIPGCISDFLKTFFIPPFSVFYFIILVHFFIIYPKVPLYSEWYKFDSSGTATTNSNIAEVQETLPNAKVGDKVTKVTTPCYFNPIVKLNQDNETEDETAALTVYLKRNVNIETERKTLARKTIISADEHYIAALSDESKVVIAKFKK